MFSKRCCDIVAHNLVGACS